MALCSCILSSVISEVILKMDISLVRNQQFDHRLIITGCSIHQTCSTVNIRDVGICALFEKPSDSIDFVVSHRLKQSSSMPNSRFIDV